MKLLEPTSIRLSPVEKAAADKLRAYLGERSIAAVVRKALLEKLKAYGLDTEQQQAA